MSQHVIYVSLGGSDALAAYEIDPQTGALTSKGQVKVGKTPGAQTTDPAQRFLYVSIRGEEWKKSGQPRTVATLAIDRRTGALSLCGATSVVTDAIYLSVDKTGRYLLTSYFDAGKVAVYPIRADGMVDGQPTAVLTTGKRGPHSLQADPSNRFVYVPVTAADKILQFRFNEQTGTLLPAAPPEVATLSGPSPRHFWFHPAQNVVYFVNESSSSVTAYRRDMSTGALTAFQTLSTLPQEFAGSNKCAHVEITPDGRFLYASNRGHDSLVIYSIDAINGELTLVGHEPTEKRPRSFTIDATGRFLYSAGLDADKIAAYRIHEVTGKLERLATYEVGPDPSWVQCVMLG